MRRDVGGYELAVEVHEAESPTGSAILLHGLAGTARDWEPTIPALRADTTSYAVDLISHGGSDAPPDPDAYAFDAVADALIRLADGLGLERPLWVGYSMGARLLLFLALRHPARVGGLVLESVHPGLADPAERAHRAQQDLDDALLLEREGLDAFLDRWHDRRPFATRKRHAESWRAEVERKRRSNTATGLARCLRGLGLGRQPWLGERAAGIQAPTLLVAGILDRPYVEHARFLAGILPAARLAVVPEAGHACHVENPHALNGILRGFLGGRDLRRAAAAMAGPPA